MTLQSACMLQRSGNTSFKMLWRMFCIGCFASISTGSFIELGPDDSQLSRIPAMEAVELGLGAPFGSKFRPDVPQPAYKRTDSMIRSGLHYCVGQSFFVVRITFMLIPMLFVST